MKTIKGYITAATMFAVLAFGSTFANAGIIVAGVADKDPNPCSEPETQKEFAGIIVAGFAEFSRFAVTGIIVAGGLETEGEKNPNETCGIIVAG